MHTVLKKVFCVLLVLATLVLPMAGCGQKPVENEIDRYDGEKNMTKEEILELDKQNPITVTIMVEDLTEPSASDSPVLKAIAEATGVTIELIGIDSDRLQMLLASQEYPDVIVMNRNANFYDYLDSGDLEDLKPLLEEYAPTVYAMNEELIPIFSNDEGELLYLTENKDLVREGEVHPEDATDPTREQQEMPWHSTIYVQYPLASEVYPHQITTIEEYKEALDAYLASEGAQSYAINFDKDSAGDILWAGLSMYGYKCNYKGGLYVTDDGENYTYGLKAEHALDWLLLLNELYREGYIYEDAPVQPYEQFIRTMNKSRTFSFIGNYYAPYEANRALQANGSSDIYIPINVKMDGVEQIYQYNAAYTGAGAFCMMATSEHKARIARLLEYLYSDEGLILHGWGIEGEDYIINADGKRDLNAEIAAKKEDESYDVQRGIRSLYGVINFPTYTSDGQPAFARFAPYSTSDEGGDVRDEAVSADENYNWHDDWLGTFWDDLTEIDIVLEAETEEAIASARCAAVIKDLLNNIVMADSEEVCIARYNEAVEKVNAYGIEAWEKAINEQIQAKRDALAGEQ